MPLGITERASELHHLTYLPMGQDFYSQGNGVNESLESCCQAEYILAKTGQWSHSASVSFNVSASHGALSSEIRPSYMEMIQICRSPSYDLHYDVTIQRGRSYSMYNSLWTWLYTTLHTLLKLPIFHHNLRNCQRLFWGLPSTHICACLRKLHQYW